MKRLTAMLLLLMGIMYCNAQTIEVASNNAKFTAAQNRLSSYKKDEAADIIVVHNYKNNAAVVVCKSVDDNGNAVGEISKFKTGESINFLFKSKEKMNYTAMLWNVVMVNSDDTEEYVTRFEQPTGKKSFQFLATTQGISAFNIPGKYRVYLYEKETWDRVHGTDGKYVSMTEFTVE